MLDESDPPFYRWFAGGLTNAAYNEVDIHVLEGHGEELAYIEVADPSDKTDNGAQITRLDLLKRSSAVAKLLRDQHCLREADRVLIFMPTGIEQIVWVEACKRVGVVYCCCSPALPPEQIADRVYALQAAAVITSSDPIWSAPVQEALAAYFPEDDALKMVTGQSSNTVKEQGLGCSGMKAVKKGALSNCKVLEITGCASQLHTGSSIRREGLDNETYTITGVALPDTSAASGCEAVAQVWRQCGAPQPVEANFPLFVIFTSGTTGKPKGVVHAHAYLVGLVETMRMSFQADPGADKMLTVGTLGWITGQSYQISAVLAARITSVLMRGSPVVPTRSRFAEVIAMHGITILKAGSAFLREVMSSNDAMEKIKCFKREGELRKLKVATFCAEPVSSAVQEFAMKSICENYINSYWATEHGGIAFSRIFNDAGQPLKANAHTWALPWVAADVYQYDETSKPASGTGIWKAKRAAVEEQGEIVCTAPYPYMFRCVFGDVANLGKPGWTGDRDAMLAKYWRLTEVEGRSSKQWTYVQGDFAKKYADESYTLHGRSDEVLNVNGQLLGTEHIEGAILRDKILSQDSPVGHCVVVGYPSRVAGEVPLAFITLSGPGHRFTAEDSHRLFGLVSSIVTTMPIEFCVLSELPVTFSGKFMRRLLKNICRHEPIGDTTSIANAGCVRKIQEEFAKWETENNDLDEDEQDPQEREPANPSTIAQKVEATLLEVLNRSGPLDASANFNALSVTSVLLMRFRAKLQAALQLPIKPQLFFKHPSISSLSEALTPLVNAPAAAAPAASPPSQAKCPLASVQPAGSAAAPVGIKPRRLPRPLNLSGTPKASTAVVDAAAKLAAGVYVGHQAIIESDVVIGEGSVIEAFAVIEAGAVLGKNCHVGRFAVLSGGVRLSNDNDIGSHCVLTGQIEMGSENKLGPHCAVEGPQGFKLTLQHGNELHSHVCVGQWPEDYGDRPMPAGDIRIGSCNCFREGVTIHAPYREDVRNPVTEIGDRCYLMSKAHVAHDNHLGNDVVLGPGAQLAGFVRVMNKTNCGLGSAVHQDTIIGPGCIIGAGSVVTANVLPYTTFVSRDSLSGCVGLNSIGLERMGYSEEQVMELDNFYSKVFAPGGDSSAQAKGSWFEETFAVFERLRKQQRRDRPMAPILFSGGALEPPSKRPRL